MKKLLLVVFANLLFAFCVAQIPNIAEGPYVEYGKNSVFVRSIDPGNSLLIDSISLSEKEHLSVIVRFSNHKDWDFSVPVRAEIRNEPDIWREPKKLIAFSDIEGEFEPFRRMLIANGVIDEKYNWIFGKGHLLICGDLFDRGKDVAAYLWLLYKLEDEAKIKGGYVHTILGNHDIMNLSGDFRYVQQKYFERAKRMGVAYLELYGPDTELGRWLRSKNIIEKIGDNLCLHGGISPEILALQWPVIKINRECRPYYDQGMHPEKFEDKDLWKFFDGRNISPFWYRGYFLEPFASQGLVDSTLSFYKTRRIIVGHDIIDSVAAFYQRKILGIDVNEHEGNAQGLLIKGNDIYKIDLSGKKQKLFQQNPLVENNINSDENPRDRDQSGWIIIPVAGRKKISIPAD